MDDLEEEKQMNIPKRIDITTYKFPKIPQTVWDDEDKKWVVDSPEAFGTKIITNPKMEQHRQDIISKIVGNQQNNLSLFKDSDKDKVPNILDYSPKDKNIQSPFDKNFKFFENKKINFNKKIRDLI